jgi:hypothetical protein
MRFSAATTRSRGRTLMPTAAAPASKPAHGLAQLRVTARRVGDKHPVSRAERKHRWRRTE